MSYCMFSDESDIYMYRHIDGFIRCCACNLTKNRENSVLNTEREALEHLDKHKKAGHRVPQDAIDQLISEIEGENMNKYRGKSFKIKETSTHKQFPDFGGSIIQIEGYWNEVHGKSWTEGFDEGNPAAIIYMLRRADNNLPNDENVLYGHTNDGLGHLVHVTELEKEA